MTTPPITTEILDECITLLRNNGIKVVAFDMDLTAVARHSRGRLRRDDLQEYLSHATDAFQALVPVLHQHGFQLSIATHSDEAEFGGEIQPATHILGKELATALVDRCFQPNIASSFCILAYNPCFRPDDEKATNKIKRFHMRKLQEHFDVTASEILFFDDTLSVVDDCRDHCHVNAFAVDPEFGFRLTDLLESLGHMKAATVKKTILTVGDGDLTLSMALARAYGKQHVDLTASVLEADENELKQSFPDAPLKELEKRNVTVLYGVDATQLHTTRFSRRTSDKGTPLCDLVCFHHPHLGQKSLIEGSEGKHAKIHHDLLCHYLYSASQVSKLVHVCLCGTQPETWRLMVAAEKQGLILLNKVSTAAPFAHVWAFTGTATAPKGDHQNGAGHDTDHQHDNSADLPEAGLIEPHFPAPRRYRTGKLGSRHFLSRYGYRHRRTEGISYKGVSQDMNVFKSMHFVFGKGDGTTEMTVVQGDHDCTICSCSFETESALKAHLLAPARPQFTRRKSASDEAVATASVKSNATCTNQGKIMGGKKLMSLTVPSECDGKRLRWFLQHRTIKGLSKRKAGSMAKAGLALINSETVHDYSRILESNDQVTILQGDTTESFSMTSAGSSKVPKIDVLHRSSTEEWLVVWKPASIRNRGQDAGTLETLVSTQESNRYFSHTQMEKSTPGICVLSTAQTHMPNGHGAVSKLQIRYFVTVLVHGKVPQDWYPSKSFLMNKEAKWRRKKKLNKRKLGSEESDASEEQPEQIRTNVTPIESIACADLNSSKDTQELKAAAAILTTLQVETPDPSSGSLCHFFRHSGHPVVGDMFCKTEYWTLKRSIRNRLKDKLSLGCYKMEIVDATNSDVIMIERELPEKLSAKYWERFLEQEVGVEDEIDQT